MEVIHTLFAGRILLAVLVHLVAILVFEVLVAHLHQQVGEDHISEWLSEHLALPLARALALVVFMLIAYPTLFGVHEAPPLAQILFAGEGRIMAMVNLAVVLSLLLPLVPVFGLRTPLVLPFQGIAISALMFQWMAGASGLQEYSLWPGFTAFGTILVIALLTPVLAHYLAHVIGERFDKMTGYSGFETLVYDGLVLFVQLPSILIYSLALGAQLSA